jgi:hypothetical protein
MIEGCNASLTDTQWDNWQDEFDKDDSVALDLEEYIGGQCENYKPEWYTCDLCGKEITADKAIESAGIYEPAIVCSATCDTLMNIRVSEEMKELYEEMY